MNSVKQYTKREETANYLTHAFGAVVALVSTGILIERAADAHNTRAVVAFAIYGFGMLACMLSSTLYHYVKTPSTKAWLRHFDHANIYVLIAASFSPITLILLKDRGIWGWGLLALVWLVAFIGIGLNFRKLKTNNHLKTASYVLMGLLVFVAAKPLVEVSVANNCLNVLYWMVAGGFFYIVGSVFYALAKREFVHTIFHIFVLLGLFSHIVSTFLIPLH
jgi:hemolysin III